MTTLDLPQIPAPDLSNLRVLVPRPQPLSQDELLKRLHERVRAAGARRERAKGEKLAAGDDVQLTTVGYSRGRLVPYSIRVENWEELAPWPDAKGMFEGLLEHGAPGKRLQLNLNLRSGTPARFLVAVLAAREVETMDPDQPAVLRRAGLPDSLPAAVDQLIRELEDELVAKLQLQAQQLVLAELARRVGVEMPRSLVDAELEARWRRYESSLTSLALDQSEKTELLGMWMTDPAARAEAQERLATALALRAVGQQAGLTPSAEAAEKLLADAQAVAGVELSPGDRSPRLVAKASDTAYHFAVLDYVMQRAEVRYEGSLGGATHQHS